MKTDLLSNQASRLNGTAEIAGNNHLQAAVAQPSPELSRLFPARFIEGHVEMTLEALRRFQSVSPCLNRNSLTSRFMIPETLKAC